MDQKLLLFLLIAFFTSLSAVLVLVSQNIVRAAVYLLFTLAGSACVFFLLGADFVGATQLIIYVGGILVLVVFGVMLTAQGPFVTLKVSAAEWAIALVVGVLLLGVLTYTTWTTAWPNRFEGAYAQSEGDQHSPFQSMEDPARSANSALLGEAFLGLREITPKNPITGSPNAAEPGKERWRQRVGYLLPFEIVSVHLLVVLIGAAYLARAKRRRGVVS